MKNQGDRRPEIETNNFWKIKITGNQSEAFFGKKISRELLNWLKAAWSD